MIHRIEEAFRRRVQQRMHELGLSAYSTAKKAGLGESFVRDIMRGKARSPGGENLVRLAEALQMPLEELLLGSEDAPPSRHEVMLTGLEVVGDVSAGMWREVTLFDEGETEFIPVAKDQRFKGKQYALRVRGDSMDTMFPDGTYVTCVDFWDAGINVRDGLIVHVERTKAGGQLVEITLKAIETRDGKMFLAPKSSNPRWEPFPLEGSEDTEVKIKGLVTGNWRPTLI